MLIMCGCVYLHINVYFYLCEPKKGQKQVRDERMQDDEIAFLHIFLHIFLRSFIDERSQEDYPTSAKIHSRLILRFFISALFLNFFQVHPYLK